ncbi:hypothetical protein B0H19DRAFT_1070118 [Mycena capillaripes]|nr:hypothetical protein B0H19DRAFT_1070118 [Mycena capillaripes]
MRDWNWLREEQLREGLDIGLDWIGYWDWDTGLGLDWDLGFGSTTRFWNTLSTRIFGIRTGNRRNITVLSSHITGGIEMVGSGGCRLAALAVLLEALLENAGRVPLTMASHMNWVIIPVKKPMNLVPEDDMLEESVDLASLLNYAMSHWPEFIWARDWVGIGTKTCSGGSFPHFVGSAKASEMMAITIRWAFRAASTE